MFCVPAARAVNLHAIYTASCKREIGIILDVGPRKVSLLNLQGEIIDLDRFEVIYYAKFPLDMAPMPAIRNPEKVPLVEVKTFQKGRLETLVRGWPVDFNTDRIAFLDLRGSEIVVHRRSIWEIEYLKQSRNVEFEKRPALAYEFAHPYAFSSCPIAASGAGKPVRVFPQEVLSDPVAIKREFDRLQEGHRVVRQYESDQQFYAVPEVYKEETLLGLWMSTNSRYGASQHRDNNFTPYLVNQVSSGPFGFQSEFRTGSGPLMQSIHAENQTQVYYRMKADYFHFSAMVDPSILLVGEKAKWSRGDLDDVDARAVENAYIEFGFDYGRVALEMFLGGSTEVAGSYHGLFARNAIGLPRFGFRYQGYTWTFNFIGGSSSGSDFNLSLLRANLEWQPAAYRKYAVSVLKREVGFNGQTKEFIPFEAESESLTGAMYAYWRLKTRYWLGAELAGEQVKTSGSGQGTSDSKSQFVPKAGVMISLSF